jgi:hypothetical protein
MEKNISVKDIPVESAQEDQLKVERYIKALSNFILKSDTPITIGLQGEWGTGKTSMMYMLRQELENHKIATSWVNTWEYSMFRGARETTPAVLQGLLSNLEKSCGNNWRKAGESELKIKKIAKFFGNVANQIVSNQVGIDLSSVVAGVNPVQINQSRAEIADIKNDISDLIVQLIQDSNNEYGRVVFFIDDLDRINPTDAVEVLEALKNMFDINHCIFVLAIDYEVVVKGLEGKFGKKTEENEREFRSFFDKIIQVPFSMPTGAYDIDYFLAQKLEELDLKIPKDFTSLYNSVVKNSVGYNPRSLKRFMNTFSLLNTIRKEDQYSEDQDNHTQEDQKNTEKQDQQVEAMLFAILGIQISYPKIFRYIGFQPDFASWDGAVAAKFELDIIKLEEQVAKYGDNQLVNEKWEQVVWGLCQSDSYLKSRAFSVLELLNTIKSSFNNDRNSVLIRALELAAITSVDDNQESKQNMVRVGSKRVRFQSIKDKRQQLIELNLKESALSLWDKIFVPLDKISNGKDLFINWAMGVTVFYYHSKLDNKNYQMIYCWNGSPKQNGLKMIIYGPTDDFIDDVRNIARNFGWEIDENKLKTEKKVGIRNGLTLIGRQIYSPRDRNGAIFIEEGFYALPTDTTHAFITMLLSKLTERITPIAN